MDGVVSVGRVVHDLYSHAMEAPLHCESTKVAKCACKATSGLKARYIRPCSVESRIRPWQATNKTAVSEARVAVNTDHARLRADGKGDCVPLKTMVEERGTAETERVRLVLKYISGGKVDAGWPDTVSLKKDNEWFVNCM